MEKIFFFHYCSLPIYILILLAVFSRGATKSKADKLFVLLTVMSLFAVITDLVSEKLTLMAPLSQSQTILEFIVTYAYFLLRNSSVVVYSYYLIYATKTENRLKNSLMYYVLAGLYVFQLMVFFVNIFTNKVFSVTSENGYVRGKYIVILYVIVFIYAFIGIMHLIRCRRFQTSIKWLAFISLYVLNIVAVVIQFLMPQFVIEMFATSVALLMIVLLVYRPEETIDPSVSLPSWHAYTEHLKTVTLTGQKVCIYVIKFVNANNIRTYLGEQRYNLYVKNVAECIEKELRKEKNEHDMYFEPPGSLYIITDKSDVDMDILGKAKQRKTDTIREIENTGARLIPRVCIINCPDDISNYDDIIHLGHEFYGLIPYDCEISKASDIVGLKNFRIESNMDSILERAITENCLEMYYQPIYSVEKKKFVSAEALLRLKDREFGFISPGIFIPAAESRGLIIPIGDFVVESVFKFMAEHDLEKLGIEYIEPNLSVAQCLQPELPDKIRALQERYGVSPKKINFEITETFFDNVGEIMDNNLKRLTDMGFNFSLDDYGTGYSNIKRVARLPFSIIKIDKSLIDHMDTQDGKAIIYNTIKMMKDIRKEIVAEGVETEQRLNDLIAAGCDHIQGFYFSKPLPADEFLEFIKKHNA